MNMIASVLHLDRGAMQALRVTDPYSLHRVVYGLYADVRSETDKTAGRSSGILYADRGGDIHGRRILLLADRAPSDCAEGGHGRVDSRPVPEGFLAHDRYRFTIIVNPVRRENASGKIVPIKGREAVVAWFAECAPRWGFDVSSAPLQIDRINVQHFTDKALRPVTLAQAHVAGLLRVTDRAQFRASFTHGIGRGRSFGCGLLQIVPLVDPVSA
jgi:CRISPR system Cascade subunit CasE